MLSLRVCSGFYSKKIIKTFAESTSLILQKNCFLLLANDLAYSRCYVFVLCFAFFCEIVNVKMSHSFSIILFLK